MPETEIRKGGNRVTDKTDDAVVLAQDTHPRHLGILSFLSSSRVMSDRLRTGDPRRTL